MKKITATSVRTILFVFFLLISAPVQGAFVNGIESFDGSVKDTDTWEEWFLDVYFGSIIQNDRLTITSCADYTTKTLTVGIGEAVSVEVYYENPPEMYGSATLCFTDNSAGLTDSTGFDTNRVYVKYDEYYNFISGGYGVTGAWMEQYFYYGTPPTLNSVILELGRLSPTSAKCSAYDLDWNELVSFVITTPVMQNDLYISLVADNDFSSFTFDNMIVHDIPTSLTLLAPKGGETYTVGTPNIITWDSEGWIVNVQLDYSADNGSTWHNIKYVANTGSATWIIPNTPSLECLIKITDADDPSVFDISDAVFTIQHRCYEPIVGDLDGDCMVGLSDFAMLAENWMNRGNVLIRGYHFDEYPYWAAQGQWEFGQPLGSGGFPYGFPDPTSGYTGINVYGMKLSGNYDTSIGNPYYLTTEPIDCTDYTDIRVSFMSWLNIDDSKYAQCTFEVSANGMDWVVLWSNTPDPITDNEWQKMEFDISEYSDDNPTLYLRWGYQIIDRAYPYSGWNIDDVELGGAL